MINVDLKNIEIIPSSTGGGEYDDTAIKSDISKLQSTKADKTEIPNIANKLEVTNIKAGENVTLTTSGNNVTINATAPSGGGSATGIRTLHYKFSRAHGSYPLFIADDYSNLKAGDIYIVKIDCGTVSYPNEVTNNLFFPNIDFNFPDFNFVSQQGQGLVKCYLCYLDCEGSGKETLNIGYCNDTDYEPTNAKLKQLL